MMADTDKTINIAFMNVRGQTGLDFAKQLQIENFLKTYKIDILNCQEINIIEDSFSNCEYVTSTYNIISNNAQNKYGTCCLVSSNYTTENVKTDVNGRVITFNIENITFCNVYMHSGSDPIMRNGRENYAAEIIPQLLINSKEYGCIGGDWNSILDLNDATKNANKKQSKCLKRLVQNFSWIDSFRQLHPHSKQFSRYYDNSVHGEGAARLDRMYHHGGLKILEAKYVGVAFSDHLTLVVKIKLPQNMEKIVSPKSKPLFKAKPNVIQDETFKGRLKDNFHLWSQVRDAGLDILTWWELVVKPGIKKLLIERGREINFERAGELNLLQIRQAYLVKQLQSGNMNRLAELKLVQNKIVAWHVLESEKIKLQSRGEELNETENVRIYHHELHKKHIKRTQILKLKSDDRVLVGHKACAEFLENSVAELLLRPAVLDQAAQQELLSEVQPVFTPADNKLLTKTPDKAEVKESVWSANLHAAPGTDGLTTFLYYHCWDILGSALTDVVKTIHSGQPPTLSQRTSLMVFGNKPKKPNSLKPSDKRKISLLNADFKVTTGIDNNRFKKVATHTLSPCQLAAGDDRRIHHGINSARDAITAAGSGREGVGILDNDYKAAFDYMVLLWVIKVLRAKGLSEEVLNRLLNLYSNNITIVVINNILGKSFTNNRWSIRQGDRPSSILFCYGIDPHLDWLYRRLQGIPIYHMPAQGPVLQHETAPVTISESYKVIGYIDDVKPAITTMSEFTLVDRGSLLFEHASGCILHRDPTSGKVKFLPLGRWKGTLRQEDLPVQYIALSDHLDMIGVELRATSTQTRKANGDILQERVRNVIGPWRAGKFMPLTQRSHSVNTYCFSKVWFKSASIDLRVLDISSITSAAKSWIYADQLEKPEELILYRCRVKGGLNLYNVKLRALAELMKSFLDTANNPKFKSNLYHRALYRWHVEGDRSIPNPGQPAYFSENFFSAIRSVKNENVVNLATMKVGQLYSTLLEHFVTSELDDDGFRFEKKCKIETEHTDVDWDRTWSLACIPGLESTEYTFLWRMIHNILPTQERLQRILPRVHDASCTLCRSQDICNLSHALFDCSYNSQVSQWLCQTLGQHAVTPEVTPQQVIMLNFKLENHLRLPVAWLIAQTLGIIWTCRMEKKACSLFATRATLEANIMVLRKTRFAKSAKLVETMLNLS